MHLNPTEFLENAAQPLAIFFVTVATINLVASLVGLARRRWCWSVWLLASAGFGWLSWAAYQGAPRILLEMFRNAVDAAFTPVTFTLGCFAMLAILYWKRRFFVRPMVAFTVLNLSLLLLGLSLTDPDFAAIAMKPDNVPIVAMVFLLGFFVWVGGYQAVRNDDRRKEGLPCEEATCDGKTLAWPELVYIELICILLVTALLIVWSILLVAPLEEPANPVVTPNPSKAPWYFLGLQEMLVYSDPWNVGVVVPCLIIIGLMAIPYLDPNRNGNGYYTIDERPFAFKTFMFGMFGLWIMLILLGTFFRGPNWTFFGPYQFRDPHLLIPAHNIKLSEYFWNRLLDRETPTSLWLRELPGLIILGIYFLGIPLLGSFTFMRRMRRAMGWIRYAIMMFLLLAMFTLPLKMFLQWTMHISYLVSFPEFYLNF